MIFFDIETIMDFDIENYTIIDGVRVHKETWELSPHGKYWEKMPFMPEFNKIFTITVWRFLKDWTREIKNLEWDEIEQLKKFSLLAESGKVCWHNIKWFDLPFIIKRMMKHWIELPNALKFYWKKPWDLENIVDTLDIRKCWVFNWYGSLDLICNFLWITSPKDWGIDGSLVQDFYNKGKQEEILKYCIRDVEATMSLYEYFKKYNLV